jgi:hypothetical protein
LPQTEVSAEPCLISGTVIACRVDTPVLGTCSDIGGCEAAGGQCYESARDADGYGSACACNAYSPKTASLSGRSAPLPANPLLPYSFTVTVQAGTFTFTPPGEVNGSISVATARRSPFPAPSVYRSLGQCGMLCGSAPYLISADCHTRRSR